MMIDSSEHEEILLILEELDDQEQAVKFLKKLNDLSSALGKKILNLDESIDNNQWKIDCDNLKKDLDSLIIEIRSYGNK